MKRTLAVRVPLVNSDPEDIIGEIDKGDMNVLLDLIRDRFEEVFLNVETGDSVFH